MTGKEAGEITLHSLQVGQKQNLIPVWAINTFVCFELKQRSIYKASPWTRKDIFLKQCKVIWQHHLARRPVFGWGSQSFCETQQLQRFIVTYIYKGYLSMHVEVITRSVWCSVQWNLSNQQTRTNKWNNQRMNLWMKNANFENLLKRMLEKRQWKTYLQNIIYMYIRDHIINIIIIFYNNFL